MPHLTANDLKTKGVAAIEAMWKWARATGLCLARSSEPRYGYKKNHFSTSQSSSGTAGDMMLPMIRVPLSLGDGLRRISTAPSTLGIRSSSAGMTMTSTRLALNDAGNRSVSTLFSNCVI